MRPDNYHIRSPESLDLYSEEGSNMAVNVNRFQLPAARELILGAILALSILVNIAMFFAYRGLTQTVDLDRYDDNTFINGRFAELSAQVKADHDLIQAYGLQKAAKEKP